MVLESESGRIDLTGVCLRQGEEASWLLRDLSLTILPGQAVAVTGVPGCSSAPLLHLLQGLVEPQAGTVRCDRVDLATLPPHSVRERIGGLLGAERLFDGDVFSNIAASSRALTLEQAWEALHLTGLKQHIQALPTDLHTQVGERIGGLSPGQRQRLLLARAIAAKPSVLLLDETALNPDKWTRRAVLDVLGALRCTRIVATRRPEMLRACHRVLILEEGRIAADGGFEELMERDGALAARLSFPQRGDNSFF